MPQCMVGVLVWDGELDLATGLPTRSTRVLATSGDRNYLKAPLRRASAKFCRRKMLLPPAFVLTGKTDPQAWILAKSIRILKDFEVVNGILAVLINAAFRRLCLRMPGGVVQSVRAASIKYVIDSLGRKGPGAKGPGNRAT